MKKPSACGHATLFGIAFCLYLFPGALAFPEKGAETAATGWGREYLEIARESFSTKTDVSSPGFVLERNGRFATIAGERWIVGSSAGVPEYSSFYRTEPAELRLIEGKEYELRFDYRIIEESDSGFGALFYSKTGGDKDDWLPDLRIKGRSGASGSGLLRSKLKRYADYEVIFNVIGKGEIAVRNIRIFDAATGMIVAKEDSYTVVGGPGPGVEISGSVAYGAESSGKGFATLIGDAWIRTVPSVVPLRPNKIIVLEFDWKARRMGAERRDFGILALYAASDPAHRRQGTRIDGYGPAEGHFIGGIKTGVADLPYVVEVQVLAGTALTISDLHIYEQEPTPRSAERNPANDLGTLPFPRIGGYQMGAPDWIAWDGNGTVKGKLPVMSMAELDRRLALYDIIAGFSGVMSTNFPGAVRRLRALNPKIVLLPYVIASDLGKYEELAERFSNPLADADVEFARGIDYAWFLRRSDGSIEPDPQWTWAKKLNVSPFCPKDSAGEDFMDYFVDRAAKLHVEDGTWDGLFIDNLFGRTNPHIAFANDPAKFDADYNLNGRRDETIPWTHEMTAASSVRMLKALRSRIGDAEFILGNNGPLPEQYLAPYVNGYIMEVFDWNWYPSGKPDGFSEAEWCTTLAEYRQMEADARRPAAIILHGSGLHPNEDVTATGSYRDPTPTDIRIQRIAVGTALLGDGFYEFDLFDSRSPPAFFDEQLVGPGGASVDTESGKGWLGKALGPAVEIVRDPKLVKEKAAETKIGGAAGRALLVDCGVNASAETLQYVIELDWRITRTLSLSPVIETLGGSIARDSAEINAVLAGSSGHARIHATVPSGAKIAFRVRIPDAGAMSVRNLRVTSAHAALFRRDYQNGFVLVNASKEPRTLVAADLRGVFARTGIVKIRGRLDPAVNDGKPIDEALTIPAADAIVLRSDHLER